MAYQKVTEQSLLVMLLKSLQSALYHSYAVIRQDDFPPYVNVPVKVKSEDRDEGYEKQYDGPYFKPASEEEELIFQLNNKLFVPEIPYDCLE